MNDIFSINSRTDLDPTKWGPKGWFFIDSVGLAYPDKPKLEDKQQYMVFFNSLPYILPCTNCGYNMNKHIKSKPLTMNILETKERLIEWIIDLHNSVNQSLNKPTISIKDFYAFYNNKYHLNVKNETCKITCGVPKQTISICKKKDQKLNFMIILIFGAIVALSLYIYKQIQFKKQLL
jgi:hypothetical protein